MNILTPYPSKLTDLSHHCTIATIDSYSNQTNLFIINSSFAYFREGISKKGKSQNYSDVRHPHRTDRTAQNL